MTLVGGQVHVLHHHVVVGVGGKLDLANIGVVLTTPVALVLGPVLAVDTVILVGDHVLVTVHAGEAVVIHNVLGFHQDLHVVSTEVVLGDGDGSGAVGLVILTAIHRVLYVVIVIDNRNDRVGLVDDDAVRRVLGHLVVRLIGVVDLDLVIALCGQSEAAHVIGPGGGGLLTVDVDLHVLGVEVALGDGDLHIHVLVVVPNGTGRLGNGIQQGLAVHRPVRIGVRNRNLRSDIVHDHLMQLVVFGVQDDRLLGAGNTGPVVGNGGDGALEISRQIKGNGAILGGHRLGLFHYFLIGLALGAGIGIPNLFNSGGDILSGHGHGDSGLEEAQELAHLLQERLVQLNGGLGRSGGVHHKFVQITLRAVAGHVRNADPEVVNGIHVEGDGGGPSVAILHPVGGAFVVDLQIGVGKGAVLILDGQLNLHRMGVGTEIGIGDDNGSHTVCIVIVITVLVVLHLVIIEGNGQYGSLVIHKTIVGYVGAALGLVLLGAHADHSVAGTVSVLHLNGVVAVRRQGHGGALTIPDHRSLFAIHIDLYVFGIEIIFLNHDGGNHFTAVYKAGVIVHVLGLLGDGIDGILQILVGIGDLHLRSVGIHHQNTGVRGGLALVAGLVHHLDRDGALILGLDHDLIMAVLVSIDLLALIGLAAVEAIQEIIDAGQGVLGREAHDHSLVLIAIAILPIGVVNAHVGDSGLSRNGGIDIHGAALIDDRNGIGDGTVGILQIHRRIGLALVLGSNVHNLVTPHGTDQLVVIADLVTGRGRYGHVSLVPVVIVSLAQGHVRRTGQIGDIQRIGKGASLVASVLGTGGGNGEGARLLIGITDRNHAGILVNLRTQLVFGNGIGDLATGIGVLITVIGSLIREGGDTIELGDGITLVKGQSLLTLVDGQGVLGNYLQILAVLHTDGLHGDHTGAENGQGAGVLIQSDHVVALSQGLVTGQSLLALNGVGHGAQRLLGTIHLNIRLVFKGVVILIVGDGLRFGNSKALERNFVYVKRMGRLRGLVIRVGSDGGLHRDGADATVLIGLQPGGHRLIKGHRTGGGVDGGQTLGGLVNDAVRHSAGGGGAAGCKGGGGIAGPNLLRRRSKSKVVARFLVQRAGGGVNDVSDILIVYTVTVPVKTPNIGGVVVIQLLLVQQTPEIDMAALFCVVGPIAVGPTLGGLSLILDGILVGAVGGSNADTGPPATLVAADGLVSLDPIQNQILGVGIGIPAGLVIFVDRKTLILDLGSGDLGNRAHGIYLSVIPHQHGVGGVHGQGHVLFANAPVKLPRIGEVLLLGQSILQLFGSDPTPHIDVPAVGVLIPIILREAGGNTLAGEGDLGQVGRILHIGGGVHAHTGPPAVLTAADALVGGNPVKGLAGEQHQRILTHLQVAVGLAVGIQLGGRAHLGILLLLALFQQLDGSGIHRQSNGLLKGLIAMPVKLPGIIDLFVLNQSTVEESLVQQTPLIDIITLGILVPVVLAILVGNGVAVFTLKDDLRQILRVLHIGRRVDTHTGPPAVLIAADALVGGNPLKGHIRKGYDRRSTGGEFAHHVTVGVEHSGRAHLGIQLLLALHQGDLGRIHLQGHDLLVGAVAVPVKAPDIVGIVLDQFFLVQQAPEIDVIFIFALRTGGPILIRPALGGLSLIFHLIRRSTLGGGDADAGPPASLRAADGLVGGLPLQGDSLFKGGRHQVLVAIAGHGQVGGQSADRTAGGGVYLLALFVQREPGNLNFQSEQLLVHAVAVPVVLPGIGDVLVTGQQGVVQLLLVHQAPVVRGGLGIPNTFESDRVTRGGAVLHLLIRCVFQVGTVGGSHTDADPPAILGTDALVRHPLQGLVLKHDLRLFVHNGLAGQRAVSVQQSQATVILVRLRRDPVYRKQAHQYGDTGQHCQQSVGHFALNHSFLLLFVELLGVSD